MAPRSIGTRASIQAAAVPPAAALIAARVTAGAASKALQMEVAQRVYRGATTESFRAGVRGVILGRTYRGSIVRAVGVVGGVGGGLWALVEPVPATGRLRLMLFDHDAEETLLEPVVAHQFQVHWRRFLPPRDPRVQRVAAVLWKLVNRLDPALARAVSPASSEDAGADESAKKTPRVSAGRTQSTHPMLREGARWTVHVIESPEINAWIAPGGHIFVHTGLLRAVGRDDNMLAFVLAHEMAHQLARHHAEKATLEMLKGVYRAWMWALAATVGADFFGGTFFASALVGAEAAAEVAVSLPFSRTMEYEADAIGQRIMSRACFDPAAGPRVMLMFERYAERMREMALQRTLAAEAAAGSEGGGGSGTWKRREAHRIEQEEKELEDTVTRYLSTHPLNNDRVVAMRATMATNLATLEETKCWEYMRALNRSLASRVMVPNEFPENQGRVFLPSEKWRAKFVKRVDEALMNRPGGMLRVLDGGIGKGDHGQLSGPLGRFDERRTAQLRDMINPATPAPRTKQGTEEEAGQRANVTRHWSWSGSRERPGGFTEEAAEERPASVTHNGHRRSSSRSWRGPVRRTQETHAAINEAAAAAALEEEEATRAEADPEDGEELAEVYGRLWGDMGARAAVRTAATAGLLAIRAAQTQRRQTQRAERMKKSHGDGDAGAVIAGEVKRR